MSAGDLVNNLGKLELKLKQVNFRNFRRSELLSGTLDIYVSIYGYVFSNFNRELSKLIATHELELYGKSSKRFVDNLYLIVRDILHYKPPITKDMFLSKCGFVEMKMIMCTQILELVLAKCKALPSIKKNCRKKPGDFSSSSTPGTNGKNKNITDNSDCENANYVTTSSATSDDSKKSEPSILLPYTQGKKISTIQTNEKTLNSVTKTENTGKTNTLKPKKLLSSSCRHHLLSNHIKLADGRVSTEIIRHSISNNCAIAKNPVSKCNVARTSYAKGKAVVLEKQEPPLQKVEIKVLKGPLQIDDGFSGVLRIIPPEELSHVSFCQNPIPSARSSVISKPKTPAEQSTSITNATMAISSLTTTTTTIPRSTENDTITTPGSENALLTLLTSSTITKPQKSCPATTTTIPISTSTNKLKCPPKDTAPTVSKFVENTTVTMLIPSDENNQPKEINLTSSSTHAVGTIKVADVQKQKASHSEVTRAAKALSQIKNLSQNLTGCAVTLRQMQERGQQWDTQNAFLNCSEQNKENAPTLNKETIPVRLGCEIGQESVGVSKTKESEDQTHQMDYWIAKMNLMECAVKSLESKFKSL